MLLHKKINVKVSLFTQSAVVIHINRYILHLIIIYTKKNHTSVL